MVHPVYYSSDMQHPIRSWCASQNPPVKIGDFAKKLGISRIHLGRLMRADGNFKIDTFNDCERATRGDLKALELIAHFQKQQDLRAARERGALAPAD